MQRQLFILLLIVFFNWGVSLPREGLPLLSPGGIGGIFTGPSSETIIRGPDGSEIVTEEKPGSITREDSLERQPIVVAETEENLSISTEKTIVNEQVVSSTISPSVSSTNTAAGVKLFTPEVSPLLPSIRTPLLTGEIYNEEIAPPLISPTVSFVPYNVIPVQFLNPDSPVIDTEINLPFGGNLGTLPLRTVSNEAISVLSGFDSSTITAQRQILTSSKLDDNQVREFGAASVISSTVPPPVISFEVSSTEAPPTISSTTQAPPENAIPVITSPERKNFVPIVEYNSISGVINDPRLSVASLYSSTEVPISSSTVASLTGNTRPAVPVNYLVAPDPPFSTTSALSSSVSETVSTTAASIQKIPKVEDSISVDDRIDMGHKKNKYKLPEVLSMALARFYRKNKNENKDNSIIINDKLGELTKNEIISGGKPLFSPPPLAGTEYIGPALERSGIDISKVNLEHVPLSEVTRLSDESYGYNIDQSYFPGRYQRDANRKVHS